MVNLCSKGRSIDSVSRQPLWEIGVDYSHETGHGISHNGAVVEGIQMPNIALF